MKSFRWSGAPNDDFLLLKFGKRVRKLKGEGAQALFRHGAEGRITFVDKKPRREAGHICAIGVPDGIILAVYPRFIRLFNETPTLAFVKMCPAWKRKLGLSRAGRARWLKYAGVKMGAWTGGTVSV